MTADGRGPEHAFHLQERMLPDWLGGEPVSARPTSPARSACRAGCGDLVGLFRALGDLKRVRSAGRAGSIAERLFAARLVAPRGGRGLARVAARECADAPSPARLGGLDGRGAARRRTRPRTRRAAVRTRAVEEVGAALPDGLCALLAAAPDPTEDAGPAAGLRRALATQPRAGATAPGRPRLVLEPPENHAEHCGSSPSTARCWRLPTGARPETVFLPASPTTCTTRRCRTRASRARCCSASTSSRCSSGSPSGSSRRCPTPSPGTAGPARRPGPTPTVRTVGLPRRRHARPRAAGRAPRPGRRLHGPRRAGRHRARARLAGVGVPRRRAHEGRLDDMSALHDPVSGRPLTADTPHSLSDGLAAGRCSTGSPSCASVARSSSRPPSPRSTAVASPRPPRRCSPTTTTGGTAATPAGRPRRRLSGGRGRGHDAARRRRGAGPRTGRRLLPAPRPDRRGWPSPRWWRRTRRPAVRSSTSPAVPVTCCAASRSSRGRRRRRPAWTSSSPSSGWRGGSSAVPRRRPARLRRPAGGLAGRARRGRLGVLPRHALLPRAPGDVLRRAADLAGPGGAVLAAHCHNVEHLGGAAAAPSVSAWAGAAARSPDLRGGGADRGRAGRAPARPAEPGALRGAEAFARRRSGRGAAAAGAPRAAARRRTAPEPALPRRRRDGGPPSARAASTASASPPTSPSTAPTVGLEPR